VNVLTNQSPPYDPAMGTYQLRGCCAALKGRESERWTPLLIGMMIMPGMHYRG